MEEDKAKTSGHKFILPAVVFFFILGIVAIYMSVISEGKVPKGFLRLHGWVEGTEVSLSSKVKGQVIQLHAEEGSEVQQDQLIAKIDAEQIKAQIANADAEVAKAQEAVRRAGDDVMVLESRISGARIALELVKKQSEASIAQSEAEFGKAEKDYRRFSSLAEKKSIAQSRMDEIKKTYEVARAGLDLAKSSLTDIRLKENDVVTLSREIATAKRAENMSGSTLNGVLAKKNEIEAMLEDTFVYSPVKGTVIDKAIELGENVVPGTPLAVVVDLASLYVKTYVDQRDIGKIKLGDEARIYVDSFPDRHFPGKVILIAPKAEFTPRDVQMNENRSTMVYKIKVAIDNPQGILKPGMPADVNLRWDKNRPWK
ncbi:MAG: HlyD family efflux transporter periplasmic adaptor subunit [Desulfobacterium sp.]|nr:HlyD family efflux transporter periplasmic adaptor subunit [Desulfobacterium sp.]MBU3949538.1 efflux RND transporter periplasmic adaptor subunit [Pseudomonadota bacterium]MBU4037705.1 efflux RND transporter periplasmic adaptor subunit [Pseudomonadota bacterium]